MSGAQLFGTDGIRGRFGEPPLVRETVLRLATCFGEQVRARHEEAHGRRLPEVPAPLVILGGDTRESTPALVAWLIEGLAAAGVEGRDGGVLPTPAIAFLVSHTGAAAGIAISASHNPYHDNGLKFFGADGFKLSDERERDLECRYFESRGLASQDREPGFGAGDSAPAEVKWGARSQASSRTVSRQSTAQQGPGHSAPDPSLRLAYRDSLSRSVFPPRALAGTRVLLDCANGAASTLAPEVFALAGAAVVAIGERPNGRNINLDCGSTEPAAARAAVVAQRCDFGFLFDGDADRVLLVDESGGLHDGDELLLVLAGALADEGRLSPPRVVATTMSNLGLDRALMKRGIALERCGIGDRAVVATLRELGLRLGAEQSGHVVDLQQSTSGDGLLVALRLATLLCARRPQPASCAFADFERFPQVLLNVPVQSKPPFSERTTIERARLAVEAELRGDDGGATRGRLVLRYSGTEPLARVMIEANDAERARRLAEDLASVIAAELG